MALHGFLQGNRGYANTQALGAALKALQEEGLDQLPLPGSGQTLERFSRLAQVAGHDLRLCKLFEGHTDALAIIAELDSPLPPLGSTWGMWAAEPPTAKVHVRKEGHRLIVQGRKAWCSGAAVVSHGLLTAWDEEDRQQLVAVHMDQPGITVTDDTGGSGTAAYASVGPAAAAVTQQTNINTAVTIDSSVGKITTVSSTIAAAGREEFGLTNASIANGDVVLCTADTTGTGTPVAYASKTANGSCIIVLENKHASAALNAAVVISFIVHKVTISV